ncbi:MAG: trypsin-like peptidase domain-containing protein [Anaerolineales bacterium]|nr:trypsin-like peptidase domain-containing protein [Anaerolineales bacterium]
MTILQQLSQAMAAVTAQARRSLVQLTNGQRGGWPAGQGSGILWSPDGLIITNAHVVQRRALTATLPDGRELPARLLAHDAARDIAALQVDAAGLPAIALGDSRALRPGDWVAAVGHPFGVAGAATAGVVIGSGPDLPEQARGGEWIAVNLRLRPGNSGGPLVDAGGRLVGVNTLMTGPEAGGAVPVHVVQQFMHEKIGR